MKKHFAWQMNEYDRRLIERLACRYGYTVLEVLHMAHEIVLSNIDSVQGEGEPLVIERNGPIGMDYFLHAEVPEPDANVDILSAWDYACNDIVIGRYLLDHDPRVETASSVARNATAWVRFWSVRHPDPEWRKRYAATYDAAVERINRLGERINERLNERLKRMKASGPHLRLVSKKGRDVLRNLQS